jgi:membrane protein implicated in regulation of membrane protease activity
MHQQQNFFKESKKALDQYIKNRLQLIKLQSIQKVSNLAATIVAGFLMLIFGFFMVLFLSITAAYYLASVTDSLSLGFGIVAAFYLLLVVLIIVLRKKVISKYVTNAVINSMFK